MSFLVDANVISEAIRADPEQQVIARLERHDATLHVSTLRREPMGLTQRL